MGQIGFGGVREGGGHQLLLGGKVVEHKGVAHAEHGRHIGDPYRRDTPYLDLLDGSAQQFLAPLRHT